MGTGVRENEQCHKSYKVIFHGDNSKCNYLKRLYTNLFVCVEVLRPSQPNGVMLSAVSLPNQYTGQT